MNDMFERTPILQKLFDTYKISELEIGKKKDKLGDVFEDYCVQVLSSEDVLREVVEGYYDESIWIFCCLSTFCLVQKLKTLSLFAR